jgi:hypothetical protein
LWRIENKLMWSTLLSFVCIWISPYIRFWMPEPIFIKFGIFSPHKERLCILSVALAKRYVTCSSHCIVFIPSDSCSNRLSHCQVTLKTDILLLLIQVVEVAASWGDGLWAAGDGLRAAGVDLAVAVLSLLPATVRSAGQSVVPT